MRLIKTFFGRISKDLQHKELIPLKILFFVHASTILVLYPYLTIHMRELGISVEETAIMSAVTPIVAIVMPPVAGMIADKIGNFKLVLAICSSLSGVSALLLLLVPVGRMTVTFPPRVELTATCPEDSLVMSMYHEYPCDLVHPYTADIKMRVESCGFACHAIPGLAEDDLSSLETARGYVVKLRVDAGATAVYRYSLPEHPTPGSLRDEQHSKRQLKNDEHYSTIVRRLSDTTYFFPTSNLYKIECDLEADPAGYSCHLGGKKLNLEGKESPEEMKYLARIAVDVPDSTAERAKVYQTQLLAGVPKDKMADPTFVNVTCQDGFAKLLDLSVEVPLYNPNNHQEIYRSLELSECVSSCMTTTPRGDLCSNPSEHIELDPSLTFWSYLAIRMILGIIGGTAFAMFEGAVIAILRDQNADYGLQRIYGSIGGMISSPLSGMLIDYASKGKGYTDFRPAFYLYTGLKVLSGVLMLTINLEFKTPATNIVADVISVLKNVEIVALFIACFVLGTAWGYIESFLFWLLQDLGASRSLMGVTITVGGIAGLPLLVMSGPIIKRIGHANVLFIGFVFYAVRLLGYSLIYNPWLCLIFEAMEGVTSSLAFTAAVTYAARLSTTTTDTSVQGLLGGVYFGVGKGSGSLIGGYLMKAFGTRATYQIFSASIAITGCIYFLFNKLYLAKRPQQEGNDICKKIPKVKPDDIEFCEKDVLAKMPKEAIANGNCTTEKENSSTKEINANPVSMNKSDVDGADVSNDANLSAVSDSINANKEVALPDKKGVDNLAYDENEVSANSIQKDKIK